MKTRVYNSGSRRTLLLIWIHIMRTGCYGQRKDWLWEAQVRPLRASSGCVTGKAHGVVMCTEAIRQRLCPSPAAQRWSLHLAVRLGLRPWRCSLTARGIWDELVSAHLFLPSSRASLSWLSFSSCLFTAPTPKPLRCHH